MGGELFVLFVYFFLAVMCNGVFYISLLNIANSCKSNPDEHYFTLLTAGFWDLT